MFATSLPVRVTFSALAVLAGCSRAEVPTAPPIELPRVLGATGSDSGRLEVVAVFAAGPMPTGVAVSREGRVFVSFPRWADPVDFTVAELVHGRPVPYPDARLAALDPAHPEATLVSVQSVVVDGDDRLWLVDTGNVNFGDNLPGGPKLVGVDLTTNRVFRTITFPADVVLPSSYLNDVRFDLRRGPQGTAFLTDSSDHGPNGIVVVDLATGRSSRCLHDHPSTKATPGFAPIVEGQPLLVRPPDGPERPLTIGSDGIALSADGETLYYRPLISHHLYSASTSALASACAGAAATVRDLGDLGYASDGLEHDAHGRLYLTDYEHHAIHRRTEGGRDDVLVSDPQLIWPDSLAISSDGYLYVTVNQLDRQPRFHRGKDLRQPPWVLFRTGIDAARITDR